MNYYLKIENYDIKMADTMLIPAIGLENVEESIGELIKINNVDYRITDIDYGLLVTEKVILKEVL